MYKKSIGIGLITGLMLGMPVSARANDIEQQIKEKQVQLQNQENQVAEQNQKLETYNKEQEMASQRIAEVERVVAQTQQEMDTLMQEMSTLEVMIQKREDSIEEQARQVQVMNQGDYIIEAIFSAESIVDMIAQVVAAAQLSRHSTDMLEKQQHDQEMLEEKRVTIENKTTQYLAQRQELAQLQTTLDSAIHDAEITRVALALESAKTQEDITRLTEQKEEAERQKAKALEEERQRQAIQQQVAAQMRAAATPVVAQANATVAPATPVTPPASVASAVPVTAVAATTQTGFIYPLANPTVTSGFGVARQLTLLNGSSYSDIHNGIDYVNGNSAAPIVAVADGVVMWAGTDSSGGVGVIIKHANGLYTHYWHLSSLLVSSGTTVTQGQQIGIIGKTGLATGVHLHFGVSTQMYGGYVNPSLYVG